MVSEDKTLKSVSCSFASRHRGSAEVEESLPKSIRSSWWFEFGNVGTKAGSGIEFIQR